MPSRTAISARSCWRRSTPPWSARGSELPAGDHARRRRRLRQRHLPRLLHPDLHPDPALLDPTDALLPMASHDRRLHPPGGGPLPQHLPAGDPADRRRRNGHRHQPDPGDHRPQHRLARGRGAHRRLRTRLHETGRAWRRALAYLAPGLAACGVVVAMDQGSKALVTSLVDRGDRVEVLPFLHIENVRNEGVAFGLGGDISAGLIGVTIVLLVGFLVFLAARGDGGWRVWLPAALLLGGALGNLADRARDGAVIDFIDLPLWPTFNLADVAITLGVLLLLLDIERGDRGRSKG